MYKALRIKKLKLAAISTSKKYLAFYLSLPFHKGLEIEFQLDEIYHLFKLYVGSDLKGDHASLLNIEIYLLGLRFDFNIYDGRHWNWDANRFYLPGEEEAKYKAQRELDGKDKEV